ncbi:protein YpaB [Escherichia coli]|nr:protein YpaB [Escherichia coli]
MTLLQVHNFVDNSGRKKWLSRTLGQTRCPGKSMGREKFVKNNCSVIS